MAAKTKKPNFLSPLVNVLLFCIWYILLYAGYWAMSNLQSTMNAEGGLGPTSQAVFYGFSMLSALLLPQLAIQKLGCKGMMVIGSLSTCFYIASNIYLHPGTLVTASVVHGVVTGPFIASEVFYISELARQFHSVVTEKLETVTACFFGAFAVSMSASTALGNVISYAALRPAKVTAMTNHSVDVDHLHPNCGVRFDADVGSLSNSNLTPPSDIQRWIFVGILTCVSAFATVVLVFFLEPVDAKSRDLKGGDVGRHILAAVGQLKKLDQVLLLPLSIYIGLEPSFYSNEFTQAYIACSWGVHHVGFVTVCFGVCGAVMALLVGPLVKCVSQMAVLLLAAAANAVTCALLFFWTPSPDSVWEYFVFAGVWGVGDAIWWSQVTALYGLMFPNDREAAFSNLYFWSFLGFFLSYSYANYFSVAVKISILLAFLGFGILGYLIGQIKLKCYSSHRHEYLLISDEQ